MGLKKVTRRELTGMRVTEFKSKSQAAILKGLAEMDPEIDSIVFSVDTEPRKVKDWMTLAVVTWA